MMLGKFPTLIGQRRQSIISNIPKDGLLIPQLKRLEQGIWGWKALISKYNLDMSLSEEM